MIKEEFFDHIEDISVSLIDLDEKDYGQLGSVLLLFDKIKETTYEQNNSSMTRALDNIYELIGRLILHEIEPLDDPQSVFAAIYSNFDSLKKIANDILKSQRAGVEYVETTQSEATSENDNDKLKDEEAFLEDMPSEEPAKPEKKEVPPAKEEVAPPPPPPPPPPAAPATPEPTGDVLDGDGADDELFMDFVNEAREYVATLENLMLDLEQTPGDLNLINEIFRPFHTLKGVSGFMGLSKINHISHEAENILDKARNGKLDLTGDHCTLIFKTIDIVKQIISGLDVKNRKENVTDEDVKNIVALLKSANEPNFIMGEDDNIATTRAATPAPAAPTQAAPTVEGAGAPVNPFVDLQEDIKKAPVMQAPPPAADGDGQAKKQTEESIRVKIDKLDFLIDMVGELVITANLIFQDKNVLSILDHDFIKKKGQMHRVTSDLHKASMALRMVPISQTFTKMKRVIRDYSAQHKKPIDLVLVGEETEIDRNMVDSLYEPLVHMIRNACDHGIEPAEERTAKGKPVKGTVTLRAYHKGNTIVIDVTDDGKGLNKEKILAKAHSKGLISEGQQLSDSEIYKLVFLPGFSTMEVVSNVSGRGVGMDVVMQAIKLLGGTVEILSEPDKGSTFRIALPLTLAIIEGMLVKVSGELYIIPIVNVRRSLKPDKEMLNSVMNKAETVKVEDSLIPIVRLYKKFRFIPENEDLSECLLIIIEAGEKLFSIAVDELIGIQNIVVKTLGEKFKDLDGISGATVMGDGKVGLILDCNKLDVEK